MQGIRNLPVEKTKIKDSFLELTKEKLKAPFLFSKPRKQTALIEIKKVTKAFGKGKKQAVAVKNVSFNINDKENLALLGANGAGKTTLVEMLAGITKPTKGSIKINYSYENTYQEKIGIQFQDSSYPTGLNVKNIVEFVSEVYGIKNTKKEIKEMVNKFGLMPFWKSNVMSLSGGQQQRLNILLAILNKPKILFLDELSTGLDISIRTQIKDFVYNYCNANKINIILISHDIAEIDQLTDRIIIMQNGIIKVDMYKDEIKKKYKTIENLIKKYI